MTDTTQTHLRLLVEPAALLDELQQAQKHSLRIFDAAVFLHTDKNGYRAEKGEARYRQGHIPGAAFLDLVEGFSDTTSGLGFTLPAPDALAAAMGNIGIAVDSRVVVYSSGHMMWATRAYWLLTFAGHKDVRVLNGGFDAWLEAGLPMSDQDEHYAPATYTAHPVPERFADMNEVASQADNCVVNALSADLYTGDGDFHYGRRGHIPGSQHLHYDQIIDNGHFPPSDDLSARLLQLGIPANGRVIAYCGGGIAATVDAFACLLTGRDNVAVYDGSMSEWVREGRPLTTGNEP